MDEKPGTKFVKSMSSVNHIGHERSLVGREITISLKANRNWLVKLNWLTSVCQVG